jgi:microsomal dipeptidase-like Zn-dependent dipeptidase/gamma-glutamyl-gamma-aminobutyrate hydrolase PuuD
MNIQVRPPDLKALFGEVDNFVPKEDKAHLPPRIGISANRKKETSCIAETYVQSVLLAGGAPVLIPVITDIQALTIIVDSLDGLLISGGADLNPLYLSEEPIPQLEDVDTFRDEYDLILLRLAFNRQVPILGICRGHQLLHAAFGGELFQDIHSRKEATLKHSQAQAREFPSHSVTLTDRNSKLYAILKSEKVFVNSFHHQAVKEPAPEFITTALAPDGINEGTEHPEYPILSVQWHPETLASNGDRQMQALFRHNVTEASLFARAKDLHRQILSLDLHTDAPMVYAGAFDLGKRIGGTFNPPFTEGKVNLPLMEAGRLDAAFMVAYVPQGERTETACREAYEYTLDRLSQLIRQEELHPARVGIARTSGDLLRLKREGKKAIVMGVENAYAIGKDIRRLEALKQKGVVYITLCHNGHNDICDSAAGKEPLWNGLSPFGKNMVREMNRLGIMIDVSHAAETTFYDVLKESSVPVIASHSSVRTLCEHPRNLTDEQIKTLAAKGGVMHICLYTGFLKQGTEMESPCGLSEAIRHINHVVNLAGIDHVGIGSDFDGGGGLIGCRAANELINITIRLLQEGYTEADIQKIWGANLLRVMEKVQSAAL